MRAALELIGLIYDAVVDASRWQAFLDPYVEAVRGRRGFAVMSMEAGRRVVLPCSSNWTDEDLRWFSERYAAGDGLQVPDDEDGDIRTVDKSVADAGETLLRDFPHGLSGVFLRTATGPCMIVAVRTREDGPFGSGPVATLKVLIPHLRRAALLHSEVSWLRTQLAVFTTYLDRHPYPFLLTNARARILYANRAALEITNLQDGLRVTSGHLSLQSNGDHGARLIGMLDAAARRIAPPRWLHVERPSRKPPYRLLLMPVPESCAIPPRFSPEIAAVLIIGVESRPELDPRMLGLLFDLTPTEARVAGRLGAGLSAEEIAAEMGLSVETVRTHIRHILSKTSTGRQGELIALLLRTSPFCHV